LIRIPEGILHDLPTLGQVEKENHFPFNPLFLLGVAPFLFYR
jgi:hypothetical protein